LVTSGSQKYAAVADSNNNTYIYTSTQNAGQTFAIPASAVPAGATINSVTLGAIASRSANTNTPIIELMIEKGAGNTYFGSPINLTGTTFSSVSSLTMATNPLNSNAVWTISDLGAIRFGVYKTNASGTVTARVSQISVTVNYSLPAGTGGQITANLSWNNGQVGRRAREQKTQN